VNRHLRAVLGPDAFLSGIDNSPQPANPRGSVRRARPPHGRMGQPVRSGSGGSGV